MDGYSLNQKGAIETFERQPNVYPRLSSKNPETLNISVDEAGQNRTITSGDETIAMEVDEKNIRRATKSGHGCGTLRRGRRRLPAPALRSGSLRKRSTLGEATPEPSSWEAICDDAEASNGDIRIATKAGYSFEIPKLIKIAMSSKTTAAKYAFTTSKTIEKPIISDDRHHCQSKRSFLCGMLHDLTQTLPGGYLILPLPKTRESAPMRRPN